MIKLSTELKIATKKKVKGQNVNLEWKRKTIHMRKIIRTEILLLDIQFSFLSKHLCIKNVLTEMQDLKPEILQSFMKYINNFMHLSLRPSRM